MKCKMVVGSASAWALVAGAALGGCVAAGAESRPEHESSLEEELYYRSAGLWTQRDIPVCWATAGNATEKEWVRTALRGQRSWSEQGNINFVGWGTCAAGAGGIHLSGGSSNVSFGLGQTSGSVDVTLDFTASPQTAYTRCTTNSLDREQCIKATAMHEFGHALGYAHEHNRSERTSDCSSAPQGTNGDATFGAFDIRSITAYCNFTTDLSPLDRRGTERLYDQSYGDPPRLHDDNGDGRDDLMCHDVATGYKWIDYADTSGQFNGTDWERNATWCNHDTARLFEGDFNGDGRDDLMCHDVATGYKWIDYADTSGRFNGTDWERNATWCNHETARLFVGDFNGDGRDDLMCHDVATGYKWVDYADANGQFNGTDWERNATWCNHDTGRLYLGDFNGDGRDDMLCHDVATGYKWIDYADASGRFNGTDWERNATWCNHDTAELHVGDFNGDNRDDFLCHDVATGYKWIDYADASGQFNGTDWERDATWCNHNSARLYIGDLNGDNRDDFVCHDVTTGYKWADYADASGRFNGTDWERNANWCSHSGGELH